MGKKTAKPTRASSRASKKLVVNSAEGTRLKGLRAVPADRRSSAVAAMLRAAR
ncbi:hypothetical protein ACVW00_000643 [Marmoricola sp. URHA0025 HA25]